MRPCALVLMLLSVATSLEFLEPEAESLEWLTSHGAQFQTPETFHSSRDREMVDPGYEVPTPGGMNRERLFDDPERNEHQVRGFETARPDVLNRAPVTESPESGEADDTEFPTPRAVQQIHDVDLSVPDRESSNRDLGLPVTSNVCEPCQCVDISMDCSSLSLRAFLMKTTVFNITKLELSHNRLEELPPKGFAGLPNLQRITITDNYITTVDSEAFQGMTTLERLDMSVNAIAALPVTVLATQERLERLYLRRNRLTDIAFVTQIRNCSLQALQLTTNALSRLPVRAFGQCTKLKEIWIHGNKITELDPDAFEGLPSLVTLDLSSNRLTDIPPSVFHSLKSLQVLDLTRNQLVTIDAGLFKTLTSLRSLYMPFNWLREIPASVFSSCVSLRRLDLSDNLIEYIDPQAFVSNPIQILQKQRVKHPKCANLTGSNANIPLKNLDLSNNHLRAIPVNTFLSFPDLEDLDLETNLFTTFGPEMSCLAGALGGRFLFADNKLVCVCGPLYEAFRVAEKVAPYFQPVCLHSDEPWAVIRSRRCRQGGGVLAAAEARELAAAPPDLTDHQAPPQRSQPVDNGFHAAVLAPILAVAFVTSLAAMAVSVFRRYRRARYEVPQADPVRMTMYARAPSVTSATATNSTDVSRL